MVDVPSVDRFDGKQRLAIDTGLTLVTQSMVTARVGFYRLGGYRHLLAWVFLCTAFLPPFTSRMDVDDWESISAMKQLGILWVAGVGGLVLWFAISVTGGTVTDLVI